MAARKRRTAGPAPELTHAGAVIAFIEEYLLVPEGSRVGLASAVVVYGGRF